MKIRLLLVFLLVTLVSTTGWAASDKAVQPAEFFQPSSQTLYKQLKIALDFLDETAVGLGLKLRDVRISPVIRTEEWYEYPLEVGFGCGESNIPLFLKKSLGFSFADSKLGFDAICVSVSAENFPDGSPMLSVALNGKLWYGRLGSNMEALSAHNASIVSAFSRLFKVTTMTPQIRKKSTGGDDPLLGGQTWLTNLRIDRDNRIQMTGYALDAKQVTALGEELYKCGSFDEVFICNYSRNTYEKVPVYRFDITAKVR